MTGRLHGPLRILAAFFVVAAATMVLLAGAVFPAAAPASAAMPTAAPVADPAPPAAPSTAPSAAPSTGPSATPSATPSTGGGGDGGMKKCVAKLPKLHLPVPNLPNLPQCVKEGVQHGPQALVDAASDAVLAPLANAIAKTTNQLVMVAVTGWLQMPSIRLTKSGIFVERDQSNPGGKLADGGCISQLPNTTLDPQNPATGQPSATTGGTATNAAAPQGGDACSVGGKAVSQFSSGRVQAVMISVGTIVAVLLLIVQAVRTAFTRRGTHLMDAVQGLLVMAVMAVVGIVLLDGLLVFSDVLTKQILQSSMGDGLNKRVTEMLGLSVASLGPGPVILFGLFVFTVGLVQLVMLFIRQAAIPVIAMLMPVAAAGQVGGQLSRQWLIRLWTSLFAIVLYKPLAALIFAVGFLETNQGQGFWEIVRGITTLLLAIMALPTLMKIFTPIVGMAVSIGEHNVTLAGFIGGLGEAGGILSNLTGGGGTAGGGGQDDGASPASPLSYLGGARGGGNAGAAAGGAAEGGAAAAAPVAGAALAVADTAAQVADRVDQAVAQGADAFIGGTGADPPAQPSADSPGEGRGAGRGAGGARDEDPRDDDIVLPDRLVTDQERRDREEGQR